MELLVLLTMHEAGGRVLRHVAGSVGVVPASWVGKGVPCPGLSVSVCAGQRLHGEEGQVADPQRSERMCARMLLVVQSQLGRRRRLAFGCRPACLGRSRVWSSWREKWWLGFRCGSSSVEALSAAAYLPSTAGEQGMRTSGTDCHRFWAASRRVKGRRLCVVELG